VNGLCIDARVRTAANTRHLQLALECVEGVTGHAAESDGSGCSCGVKSYSSARGGWRRGGRHMLLGIRLSGSHEQLRRGEVRAKSAR
jgi:hypothetical protein